MHIAEIDTGNRRQVREFLDFPFTLYRNCHQWVPPLESDMRLLLDRNRLPYYRESGAAFFMAYDDDDHPLGRLAVLDNRRHNQFNHSAVGRFYLLEVIEDYDVFAGLMDAGFSWLRTCGLKEIIGPKGFTALNGMGMLVRGFDHRPALGIPYNFSYYPDFMERYGFRGITDVVSGYMNRNHPVPEKVRLVAEQVKAKRGLEVWQFTNRRELRQMAHHLKDLYNGSLVGTDDVTPLTEDEVAEMANQIIWFADPHLIKLLVKDGKPVGFLLAYPDISAALQKTRGRVWPFGWLRLLRELRSTEWININGAGILAEYRGMGGTALMFNEMAKSVVSGRYVHADLVQIGVENDRMQRELSNFGIDFYKMHRVYHRML